MSWIETVPDDEWADDPGLASMHERVVDSTYGRVDNIMAIHSLDPGSMRAHLALYNQAMRGTATLRKVDREMIALVVSTVNECHY